MSNHSPSLHHDDVKVRLKHRDWEIEITCEKDKVKDVVQDVLSGIDVSAGSNNEITSRFEEIGAEIEYLRSRVMAVPNMQYARDPESVQPKVVVSTGTTCRGLVGLLCNEGYFGSEKTLGQVHEEMSRRGYNYDRTAVSHALTDIVREGNLRRVGTMRNYRYLQKVHEPTQ